METDVQGMEEEEEEDEDMEAGEEEDGENLGTKTIQVGISLCGGYFHLFVTFNPRTLQ